MNCRAVGSVLGVLRLKRLFMWSESVRVSLVTLVESSYNLAKTRLSDQYRGCGQKRAMKRMQSETHSEATRA